MMHVRLTKQIARPQGLPKDSWYSIQGASSDEAEILIYDEIGWWGITAQRFVKDLQAITAPNIRLRLNSPGGDVFDGLAIYNALRAHPAKVTTVVEGLAASIASVIALAGDRVTAYEASFLMVHNPWAIVIGDANDMRQMADSLDKISASIAGIYARKMDISQDDVRELMNDETWFDATEALERDLIDELADAGEDASAAAQAAFDLAAFRHPPTGDMAQPPEPTQSEEVADAESAIELRRRRLRAVELMYG